MPRPLLRAGIERWGDRHSPCPARTSQSDGRGPWKAGCWHGAHRDQNHTETGKQATPSTPVLDPSVITETYPSLLPRASLLFCPHAAVNRPVASEAMLLAIQRYIQSMASKGDSVGFSDSVPVLKSPTAHLLISRRRLPASGHK